MILMCSTELPPLIVCSLSIVFMVNHSRPKITLTILTLPASMTYMSIPSDHQSAVCPYGVVAKTSGAETNKKFSLCRNRVIILTIDQLTTNKHLPLPMYCSVPQMVLVLSPRFNHLAKPKSVSCMWPKQYNNKKTQFYKWQIAVAYDTIKEYPIYL